MFADLYFCQESHSTLLCRKAQLNYTIRNRIVTSFSKRQPKPTAMANSCAVTFPMFPPLFVAMDTTVEIGMIWQRHRETNAVPFHGCKNVNASWAFTDFKKCGKTNNVVSEQV